MTIEYRIRNIVIAAALAAAAVLLTVIYVTSAREDEQAGKTSVTVYAPSKDFGIGTSGAKVANHVKAITVTKDVAVTDAVTSPSQIKGLYLTQPVFAGEQLTLKRFALPSQQGVRAKLFGKQRAMQVAGDTNQVLAGTLLPGDRVDVVASLRNPAKTDEVKSSVVLRNLRVLETQDDDAANIKEPSEGVYAVVLAVTDQQAQQMYYVMKNGDWALQLRPVKKPRDSRQSTDTYQTVLAGAAR
jgi:pilus assembly protein CpaB